MGVERGGAKNGLASNSKSCGKSKGRARARPRQTHRDRDRDKKPYREKAIKKEREVWRGEKRQAR